MFEGLFVRKNLQSLLTLFLWVEGVRLALYKLIYENKINTLGLLFEGSRCTVIARGIHS